MIRTMFVVTAGIALLGTATVPAVGAPCRGDKGKFVKCPTAPKPVAKCRDAKGHFTKCGVPGAKSA